MMSSRFHRPSLNRLGLLAAAGVLSTAAIGADNAQIDQSIDSGLAYLSATQQAAGFWNYGSYDQAATGAAAFAMLSQQSRWGANAATYQANVDKAMAYLLSTATLSNVSTRADGVNMCPGGAGTCRGVYWYGAGESTYTTGLAAQAVGLYAKGHTGEVATNSGPLAGMTWGQIAQAVVNEWAVSQSVQGFYTGGWRYILGQGSDADMSTTQWGAISLTYMRDLGATVPAKVDTDLAKFLAWTQDANSGAGCYQSASSGLCDHADTGGLLLSLAYLGRNAGDPAVQKALQFLNNNWAVGANGTWYGNFGHPYAMWAEYKGLETLVGLDDTTAITNLRDAQCDTTGQPPTSGVCNWWQDYNDYIVATQAAGGGWTGYDYWTGVLATSFYLPILGGTEVPIPHPSPEPATLTLVGLALVALAGKASKRSSR